MSITRKCSAALIAAATVTGLGFAGSATAAADPLSDIGTAALQTGFGLGSPAQLALPFPSLVNPLGIAVEDGNVYVSDSSAKAVFKLAAGATEPVVLPFGELGDPRGIAVENGDVYVADALDNTIVKLAAGAAGATTLPFTGLRGPFGVAVEDGNVYVADTFNNRVLELAAGQSVPVTLPFGSPNNPGVIAVDGGDVYISDVSRRQVVKLVAGDTTPTTLPFRAEARIGGIAVHDGDLYLTDESNAYVPAFGSIGTPPGGAVRKMPGGTGPATVVPFRGFQGLAGIAVEAGTVYVTDHANRRVLAVPSDAQAPASGTGSLALPFGS